MIHNEKIMLIIMFLSGLLSTMNLWVDKISDVRLSLNDVYMSVIMIGWMYLLSGIYNQNNNDVIKGVIVCGITFILIRYQIFITQDQYIKGMIPHHSMALTMAKNINQKDISNELRQLNENIIKTQEREIQILSKLEK
jgi:hypothetical protein